MTIIIPTEETKRREAELAEAERVYAISRAYQKGRPDLAARLEAGRISVTEAFVRLHTRG